MIEKKGGDKMDDYDEIFCDMYNLYVGRHIYFVCILFFSVKKVITQHKAYLLPHCICILSMYVDKDNKLGYLLL